MSKKSGSLFSSRLLREVIRTVPRQRHFRIHQCRRLTVPQRWAISRRITSDVYMVWVRGGSGWFITQNETVDLHRGRLVLVSSGVSHELKQNHSDPLSISPVRFGIYDNPDGPPVDCLSQIGYFHFVPRDIEGYEALFEMLVAQHSRGTGMFRSGVCSSLLHLILSRICLDDQEQSHDIDPRIERVHRYMVERPQERTPLSVLAGMAGLSEKHFSRKFKNNLGVSPKGFQIRVRLGHARVLLEEEGLTVTEVANEMGYTDPFSFSKQFKKLFGYPPGRARVSM